MEFIKTNEEELETIIDVMNRVKDVVNKNWRLNVYSNGAPDLEEVDRKALEVVESILECAGFAQEQIDNVLKEINIYLHIDRKQKEDTDRKEEWNMWSDYYKEKRMEDARKAF